MSDLFNDNGANFSDCRAYRYLLWREWEKDKSPIGFIGLNPSTANENEPDPTITRVIGFAKDWGFGKVYMMNLFPYVTAYPEKLIECDKKHLDYNDYIISQIGPKCATIIFAWGNFKQAIPERTLKFIKMFPRAEALIINKNGSPRHPLYVKGDVKPVLFKQ